MARMSYENSKEFEVSGTFEVFSLSDDGDSDKVQFLMHSVGDVLAYTTHEVTMVSQKGKEYGRKIGCLKTSKDDPSGVCPLCDAGMKIKVARFVPLYSHTHKKVMLWERGTTFIDKILASCLNRMVSQGQDPMNTVIEVVRCGRKGDTSTTYQLYPMDREQPINVADLEVPDPEGGLIALWTKEDMARYAQTGEMPANSQSSMEGVQRRSRSNEDINTGYSSVPPMPSQFNGVATNNPEDLF